MNKRLFLTVILITCIFTIDSFSQNKIDLNATLPIDSSVKIGKLSNGLTYYIRKNIKPEKRVELRLVVNAGSLYETDAQQGLAHFTEHMCFNGTKNFKKNELVNFLEQMGIKFGSELNAYTSFAETVYRLQIPTDNKDLFNKGFLVLEDWASNVSFDPVEIDKERGVILEELRLGLGANDRMRKKAYPVIFKDSRYANRTPIGKKEILETFKYDTLTKFYKDWYRPNLMAVVVIGDINVAEVEQIIKSHFGKLVNPPNAKPRIEYGIPDNKEPLISIETDPEATNNSIMYFYKKPHKPAQTIADFKQLIINELYNGMLDSRFQEILRNPNAPLVFTYNYFGEFLARSGDAYTGFGMTKENQIGKAFELMLQENERVKRFGFTETEFKREKEQYLKKYINKVNEINNTESERLISQYVENFLSKAPIIGEKKELSLIKLILPEIKIDEVNECAKRWITDDNMVIMVNAPQKDNVKIPTRDTLLQILKSIKSKTIKPFVDNVSNEPLLAVKPLKGSVKSKIINKEQDFIELTLSNGVKVILKPTDFKNDEILLSAYSPGGTSLYPVEDFMSAEYASVIIDESGIGNFNADALRKKLQGKIVNLSPTISDLKEGFTGKSSVVDFETMLQLTYLYFVKPRKDSVEFNSFISKMKTQIKNIGANPQFAFYDTLMKVSTMNDPRTIVIPTEKQLDQVNFDRTYKIYCDRFADAGDFKFFIVGKFNTDSIIPLLETYLGSLPSINRKETWKDVTPKFPPNITDVTIAKGIADKGMVGIVMETDFEWNTPNRLNLNMLIDAVNIKLREKIREDESGTYGLQIRPEVNHYPKSSVNITINFGCDPKRAKTLSKQVLEVIEDIQKNGLDTAVLRKVKTNLIREREVNLKENKFWLKKLETEYFNNDEIESLSNFGDKVNKVTVEDLKSAANKYFTLNHYVQVTLIPEKSTK